MGFTVSSIGWHWNVDGFARTFRTIAFDNRGVGQSDKPDAPYSMPMFADDAAGCWTISESSRPTFSVSRWAA